MANKYDVNKTRYTHRDYASIKTDLINAIPSLTQEWTGREDSDPGIVLIKLMSMFGDTLSYNVDKIALELYIQSVTQRKNCAKILSLLGYKMHWYRAARVIAHVRLSADADQSGNPVHVLFDPYKTRFVAGSIYYTVINQGVGSGQIDISSSSEATAVKLVQGSPASVTFGETDLVNNRYYLGNYNIDETEFNLSVISGRPVQCRLVDNLDLVSESNIVCYEFNVDEYDRPYIQLADNWQDVVQASVGTELQSQFELSYILTDGSNGNVNSNAFNAIYNQSISSSPTSYCIINNLPNNTPYGTDGVELDSYNSPGKDPQSVDDAKKDSANYVFTHDTLVTSSDYEKAVKRVADITVSKLVDNQVIINDDLDLKSILKRANDNFGNPVEEEYTDPITGETETREYMAPYQVILYLAYKNFDKQFNQYFSSSSGSWSIYTIDGDPYDLDTNQNINNAGYYPYKALNNILLNVKNTINNLHTLNVRLNFGTMKLFPFKVKGILHLIEPNSPAETLQIINRVNEALSQAYYPDLHPIGEKPNFIELVDVIQNADNRIKYFDAIDNIVAWAKAINTSDPSKDNYMDKIFDTTSAIMYNGLSDQFTLAPKFLKFKIKNVGTTVDLNDISATGGLIEGSEGADNLPADFGKVAYLVNYTAELNKTVPQTKTFSISIRQQKILQLNNIAELKALCKDMNYKGYAEIIKEDGGSPVTEYISNLGLQWAE